MIGHRSYAHNISSCKLKAWKKNIQAWTAFKPISDPCDTGAVLYQLSYQANCELATSHTSQNIKHVAQQPARSKLTTAIN